jgi:hypothetical protein
MEDRKTTFLPPKNFFKNFARLAKKVSGTVKDPATSRSGCRRLHVFDPDQGDVAVVYPLHDLVDVLLEVMRRRLLQLLLREDVDGVLRGRAEPLADAAVMREGIIPPDLRAFGQFAGHACAIQRAAPEFENKSLHGASLYARSALQAETDPAKIAPFASAKADFIPFSRKWAGNGIGSVLGGEVAEIDYSWQNMVRLSRLLLSGARSARSTPCFIV